MNAIMDQMTESDQRSLATEQKNSRDLTSPAVTGSRFPDQPPTAKASFWPHLDFDRPWVMFSPINEW
jgi:hypothetical protein